MTKSILFGIGPESLAREGITETVQAREDGLRAATNPGSFEWWYFDAHFDDGSTAVIVYATKPIIRPGDPLRPNLSLTITPPGGDKLAQFPIYPAGEFSASTDSCMVRIGPSWVEQGQENGRWVYRLHAETADLAADLTFTGEVPPWRPGAGKTYFGDWKHYFAWLPAIPFGTVSGTLEYGGNQHVVRGTGYHDHNWGNVSLAAVMDHWYWGRAHVGDYSLIFVEQIAARRYGSARIPVFLLARGGEILADDSRFLTMQAADFVRHAGGREYPRGVVFTWQQGNQRIRLDLGEPALIEATSLLFALPRWQQALARLAANPYYFRFNARLDLTIELNGLSETLSGPALYELMLLR
jgi:hypothetical protein